MSSFAHTKFLWVEQVGRDRKAPIRLAVALLKYFNERKGGWAWPSVARLADDACISERTVQRDLAALVARGHLQRMPGGGRHRTNNYCMILEEKAVPFVAGPETVTSPSGNGDIPVQKPRQKRHPIPVIDTKTDSVNLPAPESIDPAINESFEVFWQQYPKKVSIGAARRAYAAAIQNGADPQVILSSVLRYSQIRTGQNERYTKTAANWLADECWLDQHSLNQGNINYAPNFSAVDIGTLQDADRSEFSEMTMAERRRACQKF